MKKDVVGEELYSLIKKEEADHPEMETVNADMLNGSTWTDWLDVLLVVGIMGFVIYFGW